MAYNTGNALGSTDARDLYDNAANLDNAVNGSAARWTDRLGVSRPSWAGMVAYADRGAYAAGIVITGYNEMFLFDGEYYRAAATTVLPYTTTGSWSDDGVDFVSIGDAVLRSDLREKPNEVLPIYNGMINVSYFGTLEEARTNSDAAGRTIVVDVPLTEAQSNIISAWPADRALRVEKGGSVNPTTTFTTTGALVMSGGTLGGSAPIVIEGAFSAGDYHVFTGSGAVTTSKEARTVWFGATADYGSGDTDIGVPLMKAIASISAGKVIIGKGSYALSSAIVINKSNITIEGQGIDTTRIIYTGTGTAISFDNGGTTGTSLGFQQLRDLTVAKSGTKGTSVGVKVANFTKGQLFNLKIADFYLGVQYGAYSWDSTIRRVVFERNTTNLKFYAESNNTLIAECVFDGWSDSGGQTTNHITFDTTDVSRMILIQGCAFEDATGDAIVLNNVDKIKIDSSFFEIYEARSTGSRKLINQSGPTARSVTITDNIFILPLPPVGTPDPYTGTVISFANAQGANIVTGNFQYRGNNALATSKWIEVITGSYVNIYGNRFDLTGSYGTINRDSVICKSVSVPFPASTGTDAVAVAGPRIQGAYYVIGAYLNFSTAFTGDNNVKVFYYNRGTDGSAASGIAYGTGGGGVIPVTTIGIYDDYALTLGARASTGVNNFSLNITRSLGTPKDVPSGTFTMDYID